MASSHVFNLVNSTLDWVAATLDAPSSGAVVFGVPIGGHLSSDHDMPPKRSLTDKVSLNFYASKPHSIHWTAFYIHNLRDMQYESPVLEGDEGVHWGIQNGLYLSRSTIVYFKSSDMDSSWITLERITVKSKRAKNLWRYIVVEAVYQNSGLIAPLDEIFKLKEKYRFLVLLDESNSFGVLGTAGRGLTEFYGVENIHDIITAAMGHALAAEGGFGTGSARVNDHQRLSSSGYVFSASLPPYLASAAITAIDVLEENPGLIMKLKKTLLYYE